MRSNVGSKILLDRDNRSVVWSKVRLDAFLSITDIGAMFLCIYLESILAFLSFGLAWL